EISCVLFPEEWGYVKGDRHDLAVVDVGSTLLETVLKNLRASKQHAEIPVLVEIGRASAATGMGILPRYRAMPCSDQELIRLARRRITSITGHEQARALL